MKWEREPWRKLYLREPNEQQLWPVLTRAFRDYLLRKADDNGVLLPHSDDPAGDICRLVSAWDNERDIVRDIVGTLSQDGYLVHEKGGALVIRNMSVAQNRKSREAERKAAQRQKKKGVGQPRDTAGTADATSAGTSMGLSHGIDQIRSDKRREEEEASGDGTGHVGHVPSAEPQAAQPPQSPTAAAAAATADADPVFTAIRKELEHEAFADIPDLDAVARDRARHFATMQIARPINLDVFLQAIRDAASDSTGLDENVGTKISRLRRYTHAPNPPRPRKAGAPQARESEIDRLNRLAVEERRRTQQAAS